MKSNSSIKKLVFIGAGNMAEALVKGVIDSGICSSSDVYITDIRDERTGYFHAAFGIEAGADNVSAVHGADCVVLAVKPQVMAEVLAELAGSISADCTVISIAAGIGTSLIEEGLGGAVHVVRVMPNTPALVGKGVSAICAGKHANESDLDRSELLLGAVGFVGRVDESAMDAITALSGSGPAYVFYIMEAMLKAACEMGVDADLAKALVYGTVEGAAMLAKDQGVDPSELRARVTSKGGTTEAAIRVLDAGEVGEKMMKAVLAARERSIELSGA